VQTRQHYINSTYLQREVMLDTYSAGISPTVLLLVNDGQELAGLLPALSPAVLV